MGHEKGCILLRAQVPHFRGHAGAWHGLTSFKCTYSSYHFHLTELYDWSLREQEYLITTEYLREMLVYLGEFLMRCQQLTLSATNADRLIAPLRSKQMNCPVHSTKIVPLGRLLCLRYACFIPFFARCPTDLPQGPTCLFECSCALPGLHGRAQSNGCRTRAHAPMSIPDRLRCLLYSGVTTRPSTSMSFPPRGIQPTTKSKYSMINFRHGGSFSRSS